MRWISSAGGPLLLLDEQSLNSWDGVIDSVKTHTTKKGMGPNGLYTDYDRACEVDRYIAPIRVANTQALVLGGEPMATAWMPFTAESGGTLVRWLFAKNEADILRSLNATLTADFQADGCFTVSGGDFLLFDSALAGRNVKKHISEIISIHLKPGNYEITTAIHDEPNQMYFVAHRLSQESLMNHDPHY